MPEIPLHRRAHVRSGTPRKQARPGGHNHLVADTRLRRTRDATYNFPVPSCTVAATLQQLACGF